MAEEKKSVFSSSKLNTKNRRNKKLIKKKLRTVIREKRSKIGSQVTRNKNDY